MATAQPKPVVTKAGTYENESNTFQSMNDAFRFLGSATLRRSKNSPPVIGKDISEGQHVYDQKTNRLYTVSNGALRYVQYT